jgi:hypothetical protein
MLGIGLPELVIILVIVLIIFAVGADPGGLACALKAVEPGLSYILLEKGQNAFRGIIDSYPRGKKDGSQNIDQKTR